MATATGASTGETAATGGRNAVREVEVPAGLKGIRVADTAVGDVRGAEGFFHYRQYSATDLAETRSLEDAWHLLVFGGDLPDAEAGAAFAARVGAARASVAGEVVDLVRAVVPAGGTAAAGSIDVLGALRAVLAGLGVRRGLGPWLDLEPAEIADQALWLAAVVPVAVAAVHRVAHDLEPIAPEPSLGHAADYLRMTLGEAAIADPAKVRALEQYLLLTMDHGFNASTFTARVTASSGTDVASAIVAALGSLAGPLHGGAPSRALAMVDEIGTAETAEGWLRASIERGDRLMGFGHAVYTTTDPRSAMLGRIAGELGDPQVEVARAIEATALRLLEEYKPGRDLHTNVEFYAALVMRTVGLPDSLFTPTFAVSRVIGWTAHVLEQATPANRIFRPSARYVGPQPPVAVPAP